jgi:RNA recognition motif-containing protein
MSKRLFVGGLSWDTNEAALRTAFEGFGEITDCTVVIDRETGKSRGFGFVSYVDEAAANSAIAAMDGATLDGRTIRVNEAHERAPRGGGGGGFGERRGGGGFGGRKGGGFNGDRGGYEGGGGGDYGGGEGGGGDGRRRGGRNKRSRW